MRIVLIADCLASKARRTCAQCLCIYLIRCRPADLRHSRGVLCLLKATFYQPGLGPKDIPLGLGTDTPGPLNAPEWKLKSQNSYRMGGCNSSRGQTRLLVFLFS